MKLLATIESHAAARFGLEAARTIRIYRITAALRRLAR